MTHQEATQLEAVDKYLLDEMTPEARDEFEEHYFDCQDCSTDLRATAAFMDGAKTQFRSGPAAKPITNQSTARSRFNMLWRPAVQGFALAASLLVIAYQHFMVLPNYQTQIARLEAPQILPTVSLIGANSRGEAHPSAAIGNAKRIQLSFEVPMEDRFKSYEGLLYAPSGALLGKVQISSQSAKDTVTMDAPTADGQPGTYRLVVQGMTSDAPAEAPATVADYHFVLSGQ